MKNNRKLSAALTKQEMIWGFSYLAFEILLLPSVLAAANGMLKESLNSAQLNFCYFLINFLAILCIFHGFLGKNFAQFQHHPAYVIQAAVLGLAAYFACNMAMGSVILMIDPTFANLNDSSIAAMTGDNFFLMAVGTVVLVPPVEECLFRGLIFRGLYGKSRWVAFVVSMAAFSAVHIMSFVTVYSPLHLALSFLQYLPAGLCLAWSYTKADSIFAPILIHAAVNALGIAAMR